MEDEKSQFRWTPQDWEVVFDHLRALAPKALRRFSFSVDHEDVVQEVILKLHNLNESGGMPIGLSPDSSGYLVRMLKHCAIDMIRKKKPVVYEDFDSQSVEDSNRQASELVEELLDLVDAEDGVILRLFYMVGLSIGEVASQYGVSYSAMAQRIHRIKEKIRRNLEQ